LSPDSNNEARQHLLNALRRFQGGAYELRWGQRHSLAQAELEFELDGRP
jgi:hypothetical protein